MYNAKEALTSDVVYAGSVTWHKNRYWNVRLTKNRQIISNKAFAKSFYGDDGIKIAEAHRMTESDLHGLTIRRKHPPQRVKEYIAGFIDGDGCFGVEQKTGQSRVSVYQSQEAGIPKVLLFIQSWYGGSIIKPRRRAATRRLSHSLEIRGPWAVWLMRDFLEVGILKREQAAEILRMRAMSRGERSSTAKDIQRSKKLTTKQSVQLTPTDQRLTWPYITGLFDAEGCVEFRGSPYICISQLSNFSILECIRHKIGEGHATVYKHGVLRVSAQQSIQLTRRMILYSITKQDQLNHLLFLHALQTHGVIPYYSIFKELCAKLAIMKRI